MAIKKYLKPKPKEDIIKLLETNGLDSQLLSLIIDDNKAYFLISEILSKMKGETQRNVNSINELVKIIRKI